MAAGLFVLVNFVLIAAVLSRGDQSDVLPIDYTPNLANATISGRAPIRITYRHLMDPASLRDSFQITPSLDGAISVGPRDLTFTPRAAFSPGVTYTVTLKAGVREASGKVSRTAAQFSIQARASRLIVVRAENQSESAWGVDSTNGKSWLIAGSLGQVAVMSPSPDGRELAYVSSDEKGKWSLWAASVDGSGRRPILQGQDGVASSLAWSPKGDLIAYETALVLGGIAANSQIWVTAVDGAQTSLIYGRSAETGSSPSWAPDGRQLAFYDRRFGAIELFSFTRTLLPVATRIDSAVSWSPDGKSIVYSDRVGDTGAREALRVAQPEGGQVDVRSLTDGSAIDSKPAWSPDGSWIAFSRLESSGLMGIWLCRPDGSDSHLLQVGSGWLYSAPIWSPDGGAVAFSRSPLRVGTTSQDAELWIAPLSGQPRQIDAAGQVMAWSP